MQPNMMSGNPAWNEGQLRSGMQVFDAAGARLGTLMAHQGGHLMVEKGLLFPQDRYYPSDEIARIDGNDIHLRQTLAALEADRDLATPPTLNDPQAIDNATVDLNETDI